MQKSFVLYKDQQSTFEKLPDESAGKLIKHIFAYVNDEDPETDDLLVEVVFESIKQTLNRDKTKYLERANRSRANGSKGGRPKKTQEQNSKPKETQKNPEKPRETQWDKTKPRKPDSVSDSDSDSVSDSDKENKRYMSNELDDSLHNARQIFEYWLKAMGKTSQTKFTEQRKQKVLARLKAGYSPRDICLAIRNCSKNPFNMGDNDAGKLYNDLTLICRNDTQLEIYRDSKQVDRQGIEQNDQQRRMQEFLQRQKG